MHPITELPDESTVITTFTHLTAIQRFVPTLMSKGMPIRVARQRCRDLYAAARKIMPDKLDQENMQRELDWSEHHSLKNGVTDLETLLAAELPTLNTYLIEGKPGYDTDALIANGVVLFPGDLPLKVPEAVIDLNAATRCIVFELPTAAGFHLHRANESVLHRYYDAVMEGDPRPTGRNMGDYLRAMKDKHKGNPVVLSAQKDLKDLHRNPLLHPEESLESVDEAIALMGSIQAVMGPMLKEILVAAASASDAAS